MGRNQYWAGKVYDLCVCFFLLYDGNSKGSTESGFMEKPGIEPATPGLQGIALIHYTKGASFYFDRVLNVLTTVYNKRTHQAGQKVTTKITISITDEFHGHVFWVLKRTVSSKHF